MVRIDPEEGPQPGPFRPDALVAVLNRRVIMSSRSKRACQYLFFSPAIFFLIPSRTFAFDTPSSFNRA